MVVALKGIVDFDTGSRSVLPPSSVSVRVVWGGTGKNLCTGIVSPGDIDSRPVSRDAGDEEGSDWRKMYSFIVGWVALERLRGVV